jgi:hypothetical protein
MIMEAGSIDVNEESRGRSVFGFLFVMAPPFNGDYS